MKQIQDEIKEIKAEIRKDLAGGGEAGMKKNIDMRNNFEGIKKAATELNSALE